MLTQVTCPHPVAIPSIGLPRLDESLAPYSAPGLIAISGPMSGGKTTLLNRIFCAATFKHNVGATFCSFELCERDFHRRIAALLFGEPIDTKDGILEAIEMARQMLANHKSRIITSAPRSWGQLSDQLLECIQSGHRVFIMDSFEHFSWLQAASRDERMQLLANLRLFCTENEVLFFFSTHALRNRSLSTFDIRDVDNYQAISASADVLLLIDRPEVNDVMVYDDGTPTESTVQISIRKNRRGPVDTMVYCWNRNFLSIEERFGNEQKSRECWINCD